MITEQLVLNGFAIDEAVSRDIIPSKPGSKLITIRHNCDYNHDQVEVLKGSRQLEIYNYDEIDPFKLAELLRYLGHPVRVVDYLFKHDIKEYGHPNDRI